LKILTLIAIVICGLTAAVNAGNQINPNPKELATAYFKAALTEVQQPEIPPTSAVVSKLAHARLLNGLTQLRSTAGSLGAFALFRELTFEPIETEEAQKKWKEYQDTQFMNDQAMTPAELRAELNLAMRDTTDKVVIHTTIHPSRSDPLQVYVQIYTIWTKTSLGYTFWYAASFHTKTA
jgi:hypothetical protein